MSYIDNQQQPSKQRVMKKHRKKLEEIEITMEEIYAAVRPNVFRNRKKYSRKNKHYSKFKTDEHES